MICLLDIKDSFLGYFDVELKDLVFIAYVHNVSEWTSFCFENEGSFFLWKNGV